MCNWWFKSFSLCSCCKTLREGEGGADTERLQGTCVEDMSEPVHQQGGERRYIMVTLDPEGAGRPALMSQSQFDQPACGPVKPSWFWPRETPQLSMCVMTITDSADELVWDHCDKFPTTVLFNVWQALQPDPPPPPPPNPPLPYMHIGLTSSGRADPAGSLSARQRALS